MSQPARYLTKSRFKIGTDCPTKLFYQDDKKFGNNNVENTFLHALAEGGFQVGELAKLYYPGGTEITAIDKDQAAAETSTLLSKPNTIIYEAAFKYKNLFIKADVVIKKGDHLELIEVKAKSFDASEQDPFYTKTSLKKGEPKLNSKWEPYLIDVAFQAHVIQKAFPKLKVTSALLLADKNAKASVDGLNQLFFLTKTTDGRSTVKVTPGISSNQLGDPILKKISVDAEVRIVWGMTFENGLSFEAMVDHLSTICAEHKFVASPVGGHCKSCEFRISAEMKQSGLQSGFENCWTKSAHLKSADFDKPFIFEIWNFRKSAKLIEEGKFFVDQITEEDISPSPEKDKVGLSNSERQWLQVQKVQGKDSVPFLDIKGLHEEMKSWNFPLHFIDFETTMVAIPFHKGRKPYEQIAFQFSHHVLTEDGRIVHQDEYINKTKGHFPNFDFVRALKKALETDRGTIFRYATHENTVLCQILSQLQQTAEDVPDRDQLIAFIKDITTSTEDSVDKWAGARSMVDQCDLVKKYFYHPYTKGSNSIKKVLPAVLNGSSFLKNKYSAAIYGSDSAITSKNYKNWAWIELDESGQVVDPYKRLPPIFNDLDLATMDSLVSDGSIADGGAAMTAYSRMQFSEMSAQEADAVSSALLKYCELDTFAMVLIYEYWKHEIDLALGLKAA